MGTLLFAIICLCTKHEAPTDYQVLPLLVSLDTIAAMLLLILLRMSKCQKDAQGAQPRPSDDHTDGHRRPESQRGLFGQAGRGEGHRGRAPPPMVHRPQPGRQKGHEQRIRTQILASEEAPGAGSPQETPGGGTPPLTEPQRQESRSEPHG